MPALPTGLRKMPAESAAATTQGSFQNSIGSASGTQLQATAIVSEPVRNRSISHGAAIAPRTPKRPEAVSTIPIRAGAKPACTSRSTAANSSALMDRFTSAEKTMSTRNSGRCTLNRRPSTRLLRSEGREPVDVVADRSVRIRPSSTQDTAYDAASAANGSQRATENNAPPIGPPTSPATCWRAWFCESAAGSCSSLTTRRSAEVSAGANAPAPMPVSSATTSRCGITMPVVSAATTSDR